MVRRPRCRFQIRIDRLPRSGVRNRSISTPANLRHFPMPKRKGRGGVGSLWGNPWFGRTDLIPPVSDPRTLLIDSAMVGHGLITPEQLAEIHHVGEQMDRVRPDLALAKQMADQAVVRERAEREALKQRKKAEAAERNGVTPKRWPNARRRTSFISAVACHAVLPIGERTSRD